MSDELASRVRADYNRARTKAFLNRIWSVVSGKPLQLLSYDEVREKLHIGGPIYRGVKTVRVDQIAGSLNRYMAFDRAFLPVQDDTASRWQRVNRAFYQDISLPPVVLYKVGEVYFVVDGHHRVSVAREQGQEFIEAEVRECATRVNITPDLKPDDLEILGEKVDFLERTHLDDLRPDARIKLTIPDGFDRMLEHIAVHRYFMGLEQQQEIPYSEAVNHWYDVVYLPVIELMKKHGLLNDFPDRTEADLYAWLAQHRAELEQEWGHSIQPDMAVAHLATHLSQEKPPRFIRAILQAVRGSLERNAT